MTPDEINALPEPVRRYIHDLETRCDPAGDLRAIADLREQVAGLEATVSTYRRELEWIAGIDQDVIFIAPETWGAVLEAARKALGDGAPPPGRLTAAAQKIADVALELCAWRKAEGTAPEEQIRLLSKETRLLMALVDLRKAGATLPEAIIRQLDWGRRPGP
jgi:hypothetical protein